MKFKSIVLTAGLALTAIGSTQAVVTGPRLAGYAYNSPYNKLYSQGTQLTFSGVITGITKAAPMSGMDAGTTLLVKNDSGGGTALVDLGPTWYVDRQVAKVKVGKRVQVTGSKVMVDGKGVILAKLVKVGTQVLALRRPSGIPYWDAMVPVADLGLDPNQIEITGTVQEVTNIGYGINATTGLVLQTPTGNVTIDLGPSWYYQRQGFVFNTGTTMVVTGPGNFALSNGTMFPAYWMRYGSQGYYFRNPNTGIGYWSGG